MDYSKAIKELQEAKLLYSTPKDAKSLKNCAIVVIKHFGDDTMIKHFEKMTSFYRSTPMEHRLIRTVAAIDVAIKDFTLKSESPITEIATPRQSLGLKRYFVVNGNSYIIGSGTFWVALPIICSLAFLLGTIKYDMDKIELSDQKKVLEDMVKAQENTIKILRHNSDSALNILGHMPYDEMTLDTLSFRKVQTTIESAGAVLYLNK